MNEFRFLIALLAIVFVQLQSIVLGKPHKALGDHTAESDCDQGKDKNHDVLLFEEVLPAHLICW